MSTKEFSNNKGISVSSLGLFLSEIKDVGLAGEILSAKYNGISLYQKDIERCPVRVAKFFNRYSPKNFFYTDQMADVLLNPEFLGIVSPEWARIYLINNPYSLDYFKEIGSFYLDYRFKGSKKASVLEVNLIALKWAINNDCLLEAICALAGAKIFF